MNGGIYMIKCTANGKVYIGSAVCLSRRKNQHFRELRKGVHKNKHMQAAWLKHGEECFSFDILEVVERHLYLIPYEQSYMDYFKSYDRNIGFNICHVAGSHLGTKRSDETKAKISAVTAGRKMSTEARKKMSVSRTGVKRKPHTEQSRAKMSASLTGRTHSKETKEKMSRTRKFVSDETRKKLSDAAKSQWDKHRMTRTDNG
jgi:group I intron endonuclease